MSATSGLKPKMVIDGRFELVEKLDDRGAGEVWKARDPNFKTRFFQLKFLRRVDGDRAPDALNALVQRLRKLKHASLLPSVGNGQWEGRPYLVQGWFEGVSLLAALDAARAEGSELSRGALEGLADQVCAALEALHTQEPPWVHGELHPGCVLVGRAPGGEFDVRVMDVGVGPFAEGGTAFIYADCVAPERREGRAPLAAGDVYSLATVLRRVLREASETAAYVAPFAGYRGREDVPAAVWEVMGRAMRHNPAERYESASAMRVALRDAWQTEARLEVRRPGEVKAEAPAEPRASGAPPRLDQTAARPAEPEEWQTARAMPALPGVPDERAKDANDALLDELLGSQSLGAAQQGATAPKVENPWATGVLRKEVSVNTALANAQGQVPEFTQAQEPAVENPWATGVLNQRVQVDEELIPTTFKHTGGAGAAGGASGAPSPAGPITLDTLIGAPQAAPPVMPAAGAPEPVIAPTVAMVNPGAWPALPAQTPPSAQPAPSERGANKGVVIAAVAMVLVAAVVAGLLVFVK